MYILKHLKYTFFFLLLRLSCFVNFHGHANDLGFSVVNDESFYKSDKFNKYEQ